ncbi:YCII-like protein [Haloferax larsenii JCM 13917]|nr:YciI family protein [Haloferax larsenii]ELZ78401.1 YCII-like protein [Haloferax larsenii JCM 13917]
MSETDSKQFVVRLAEKQGQVLDEDLLVSHVEHLRDLDDRGILRFCGPCSDGTALLILACDSIEDAREIVERDPFAVANYYRDREVVEVEEATAENNFLLGDA